jgi:carboxyl-terminal processing protease
MSVKLNFFKVRKFLLGFFVVIVVFCGGYYLGVNGYKAEISKSLQVGISHTVPSDLNVSMDLFWTVWKELTNKYYDKSKLVSSQMINGAIEGMVASIGDPYTMFLPADQNKIVNDNLSGSFEGVGIEIGFKNSNLVVISPLTGSPAEAAGVKAGDYITRITDTEKKIDISTEGLGIDQAVTDIKGPAGTKVSLTLVRGEGGKPFVVEITRAKIDVPSVTLSWVGTDSSIADIKISEFGADTTSEWDKIVTQVLQKQGTSGVIVDLRNNPGGYLQSAVDIASDFVPAGTTVVIQQDGDGTKTHTVSEDLHQRLMNYKVVVLINGGSASASEILSGALRDDREIKLVGDKSFGKGTIQDPEDIPGGSGLHITIAKWLTPKGTWVHGVGLTPDVSVALPDNASSDAQLNAAIKLF